MSELNSKILKEIKRYNSTAVFKIKYRKRANDFSLYLEAQRKKFRKTIKLENCNISGKISKFNYDRIVLKKAAEKQREYDKEYGLGNLQKADMKQFEDVNVCEFFSALVDERNGNGRKPWQNTYNYFYSFTKGNVAFKDITRNFCEKFMKYLLKKVSIGSARTYFSVFKRLLNIAVIEGIFEYSPASLITIDKAPSKRDYLTIDELKILVNTQYPLEEITQAFIFSCFTGLRLCDVRLIRFNQLKEGILDYFQTKTKTYERIKLSKTAYRIFKDQRKLRRSVKSHVFKLPVNSNINKHLGKWVKKAGIDKHITYHCSRHTFATMCLTEDIDIYTLSKLMGHKDVKVTQIYAKIIDKKRYAAVDKLPEM